MKLLFLFSLKQCLIKLKVENTGTQPVYFTYYTPLHWLEAFSLNDEHKVTRTNPFCLKPGAVNTLLYLFSWGRTYRHNKPMWINIIALYVLPSGHSYEIQVSFRCISVGVYPATLAFEFKPDLITSNAFHIVRFIETWCITALGKELAPIAPYKPRALPVWTPAFEYNIVDGLPPEGYPHALIPLSIHPFSTTVPPHRDAGVLPIPADMSMQMCIMLTWLFHCLL